MADPSLSTNWNVPANLFPGGRTQTVNAATGHTGEPVAWSAGISWTSTFEGTFRVGRVRFEPGVDVYNVFNTNPVLTENQNSGHRWERPMRILQGRLMRLTTQINF